MTTASGTVDATIDGRELAKRGAIAVGLSLVANLLVLQVVLAGEFVQPFDPLEVPSVATLTALGALGATVAYGGIARLSASPDRTFTIVAAVVLVLSFAPDIALLQSDPAATVPGIAVLMFMHVVVASICVAVLTDAWSPLDG